MVAVKRSVSESSLSNERDELTVLIGLITDLADTTSEVGNEWSVTADAGDIERSTTSKITGDTGSST